MSFYYDETSKYFSYEISESKNSFIKAMLNLHKGNVEFRKI